MRPQQVPDLVQQHRTRHRHRSLTSSHQQRPIEISRHCASTANVPNPGAANSLRREQCPHEIRHLLGRNQPCQAKRPQLIAREHPNPTHAAASIRLAAVNIGTNRRADAGIVAFAGRAFAGVRAATSGAPTSAAAISGPHALRQASTVPRPTAHAVTPDNTAHKRSGRDCQSNAESGFTTTATGSGRSALRHHSKNSTPAPSPINLNTAVDRRVVVLP